jgi:5-methylcytosine-specific restriction endonuclease McrBC regulatory subunit McrC
MEKPELVRTETRYFRVSPNGNGCGIALVGVPEDSGSGFFIKFDVLPKFWSSTGTITVDLDELSRLAPTSGHLFSIVVHELQVLRILSANPKLLQKVTNSLLGASFEPLDDESETQGTVLESMSKEVSLFQEISIRDLKAEEEAPALPSLGSPSVFWEIVLNAGRSRDLIRTPDSESIELSNYNSPLSRLLFDDIPALRDLVRRTFLDEALYLAARRKPLFKAKTEALTAVRGRMTVAGLVSRKSTLASSIECQFDELELDLPWYRLVQAANRIVAGSSIAFDTDFAEKVAAISHRLRDLQVTSPSQVMRSLSGQTVPRNLKHFRNSFTLAKYIVLDQSPLGTGDLESRVPEGLLAAIRIPTALLFEEMLRGRKVASGKILHRHGVKNLRIFDGDLMASVKQPDLSLMAEDGTISTVVDAKYKPAPNSFASMPMSDQYQQYAYSSSSGLDSVFIYVSSHHTATSSTIVVNRANTNIRVAIESVSFPCTSDLDSWWEAEQFKSRY